MVLKRAVLVTWVAACGDGESAMPDAYVSPVTVTVVRREPVADVHVYFQGPDSELISHAMTNASGEASATMPSGGFVTVLDPAAAGYRHAVTFTNVQPGDHFHLPGPALDYNDIKDITIIAPRSATADHYQAFVASCGILSGGDVTMTTTIAKPVGLVGCPDAVDLLWLAENAADQAIETIHVPSIAVANGATVDLSAYTYSAPFSHSMTIAGLPAAHNADITDYVGGMNGLVYGAFASVGISTTLSFALPVIAGGETAVRVSVTPSPPTPFTREVFTSGPYAASSTIDLAASFVSDLVACPTIDKAAHTVQWTAAAGGIAPNLQVVNLASLTLPSAWSIVGPPSELTQLPTLPTDQFDFNIRNDSAAALEDLVLSKTPSGYDGIRHDVSWAYPMGVDDRYGSGAALRVTGPLAQPGCP